MLPDNSVCQIAGSKHTEKRCLMEFKNSTLRNRGEREPCCSEEGWSPPRPVLLGRLLGSRALWVCSPGGYVLLCSSVKKRGKATTETPSEENWVVLAPSVHVSLLCLALLGF